MMNFLNVFIFILFYQIIIGQNFYKDSLSKNENSLKGFLYKERAFIDIKKYDINIDININNLLIEGNTKITVFTKSKSNKVLFDLHKNFKISSITINKKKINDFSRFEDYFIISYPFKKSKSYEIVVHYNGTPQIAKNAPWDGGISKSINSDSSVIIGISNESEGSSIWFPCKDHWSDEPDNGVVVNLTIPKGYVGVSNGKLINIDSNSQVNKSTFSWEVKNTINNYSISFYIGKYIRINDTYISKLDNKDTLSLEYWVMEGNKDKALKHFEVVPEMLDCFESWVGKYPFYSDGYKLIETNYLGMEHQSAIAYGNNYKYGYNGNKIMTGGYVFDYIIIHETGHEWFANSITAFDKGDMWIHEAFTTYMESLYVECKFGKENAIKYINDKKRTLLNDSPIKNKYNKNNSGSNDMYNKGSLFINTLRSCFDDDILWKKIFKGINKKFYHKIIKYNDILKYFQEYEKYSSVKIKPIFEQYLNTVNIPIIKITSDSLNGKNTYKLILDNCINTFEIPIYYMEKGKQKSKIVNKKENVFLQSEESIIFNQEYSLIKYKIEK